MKNEPIGQERVNAFVALHGRDEIVDAIDAVNQGQPAMWQVRLVRKSLHVLEVAWDEDGHDEGMELIERDRNINLGI